MEGLRCKTHPVTSSTSESVKAARDADRWARLAMDRIAVRKMRLEPIKSSRILSHRLAICCEKYILHKRMQTYFSCVRDRNQLLEQHLWCNASQLLHLQLLNSTLQRLNLVITAFKTNFIKVVQPNLGPAISQECRKDKQKTRNQGFATKKK